MSDELQDSYEPSYGITVDASQIAMNARTKEGYDERMQRHFDACHEAGRRMAERQEQRVFDLLMGNVQLVKEPNEAEKAIFDEWAAIVEKLKPPSGIYRAAEQINAGDMVRIDEIGLAHRVVLGEGVELDTVAATRPDHSHLSAPEVIHEARIAAGCKPGESLIERCRELNATAIRGKQTPPEWKAGKLTYEAALHHGEGLTDEDAAKWVGKPVLDETRTKTVGRVIKTERRGNFIVGTIEFYPGMEPGPKRTFLLPGEIVGPSMFRSATPAPLTVELVEFEGAPEPKQETWRDRPGML